MSINFRALIIALMSQAIQAQVWAHNPQEGAIYATLGSYTYQSQFTDDRGEVDSPLMGSAGLIINGDVDDKSSIEFGAFYLNKSYLRERGPNILVEKISQAYMTLGYRYWFTGNLSLGISSFTAYMMGTPTRVYSTTGSDPGFTTTAQDSDDHGLDLSLLYEKKLESRDAIVADIRFSRSLSPREGENSDHYALFLAYKSRVK